MARRVGGSFADVRGIWQAGRPHHKKRRREAPAPDRARSRRDACTTREAAGAGRPHHNGAGAGRLHYKEAARMAVQTPKKSSALPWPALVPLGHHAGKPPISLQKMVILVGSRHNAHLHLLSRHVSKAHALILSHGGSVYIRDLASREQVYINGVAQREAWLKSGDLLKIGSFTFKYKDGPIKAKGAESDTPPQDANLVIEGSDAPLAVAEKVMLIGRRATCDVNLIEASVSTAHAVIFHVGGVRY